MTAERARRRGFSLVEALIALSIAAVLLSAALSLQHAIAEAQRRSAAALSLADRQRSVLVMLREVNPAEQSRGSFTLGVGRVEWEARPVGEFRPARGGRHQVRLYRIAATLTDRRGRAVSRMAFDRVGWRPLSSGPASRPSGRD